MKKALLVLAVPFTLLSTSVTLSAEAITPASQHEILCNQGLMDMTAESILLMQTIAKDYLYIGTEVQSSLLQTEMQEAIVRFDTLIDEIGEMSRDDERIDYLLKVLTVGQEDLKSVMQEGYSSDNVKLVLDLTGFLSKTVMHVANTIQQNTEDYNNASKALTPRLSSL